MSISSQQAHILLPRAEAAVPAAPVVSMRRTGAPRAIQVAMWGGCCGCKQPCGCSLENVFQWFPTALEGMWTGLAQDAERWRAKLRPKAGAAINEFGEGVLGQCDGAARARWRFGEGIAAAW